MSRRLPWWVTWPTIAVLLGAISWVYWILGRWGWPAEQIGPPPFIPPM